MHHFKFIFINASAKAEIKLFNSSTQSALGKQTNCTQSVNSAKERYSRPYLQKEDQRWDRNPQVVAALENTAQAARCLRTSSVLTFLREQKDWEILRETKRTKYWHVHGRRRGRVKNHLYPHFPHYLSVCHFSQSEPSNLYSLSAKSFHLYLFLYNIPILFTSLLSTGPFSLSASICSHVQLILSENMSRIFDCWT